MNELFVLLFVFFISISRESIEKDVVSIWFFIVVRKSFLRGIVEGGRGLKIGNVFIF